MFRVAVVSVVTGWVLEEVLGVMHGLVDGEDGRSKPRMRDLELHSNWTCSSNCDKCHTVTRHVAGTQRESVTGTKAAFTHSNIPIGALLMK